MIAYSTHRGFTYQEYKPTQMKTYDPDTFEGMYQEERMIRGERFNNLLSNVEVQALGSAYIATKAKGERK